MTMNLPELLKIAEAAKVMSLPMLEFIQKQDNFKRAFTPEVAEELIKRLQEAEIDASMYRALRNEENELSLDKREIYVVMHRAPFREDQSDMPLFGSALDKFVAAAMNGGRE